MDIFGSYSGADFLLFYGGMLLTSIVAGIWIAAVMRPPGRSGKPEGHEELALLADGAARHAAAVLSSLFAKDALDQSDKNKLRVTRTESFDTDAERAVLRKVGDFTLAEVRKTLKPETERVEQRLIRRGLLMDSGERWRLRVISILPYAALLLIGLYRQQAGAALGEPTGILVVLLFVTVICAIVRLAAFNPRTMAGNAALKELEEKSSRLKRAPQQSEAGFAVALFGTAVLVGTPWEPLHAVQRAGSGDGSSTSDSGDSGDSGGDSGCGGGGCGGCGG